MPHWHAVLKHVRDARHVNKELRRILVRGTIECLLEAYAQSNGQIDLLPMMDRDETKRTRKDEPVVIELCEFDLGNEEGINDLCDMFLELPRRSVRSLFQRRRKRVPDASDDRQVASIRRAARPIGRNDRCPCGSGRKYKKCCGR